MGDQGERRDECNQCGLCCKVFGDRITPTAMNLYSWIEQGRIDILRHFSACLSNGRRIKGTDLAPEDLGDIRMVELRDPESGKYPTSCPFLLRVEKTRYTCSIHTAKPEMCWNYMPWVYGETYFPRCRALEREARKSPWTRLHDQDDG